MATEDIEGAGGGLVRMIVCRGTLQMATPMPDREAPEKYLFGPGEEVDLPADEARRFHDLGFVRRPDEAPGRLASGNFSPPALGPGHVGLVKPVTS